MVVLEWIIYLRGYRHPNSWRCFTNPVCSSETVVGKIFSKRGARAIARNLASTFIKKESIKDISEGEYKLMMFHLNTLTDDREDLIFWLLLGLQVVARDEESGEEVSASVDIEVLERGQPGEDSNTTTT